MLSLLVLGSFGLWLDLVALYLVLSIPQRLVHLVKLGWEKMRLGIK